MSWTAARSARDQTPIDWLELVHASGRTDLIDKWTAAISKYPSDPPEVALSRLEYALDYGREINLAEPRDIAEKLHWLKLYWHKPILKTLVDKFAVRSFVSDRVGSSYLVGLQGVYDQIPLRCPVSPTRGVMAKATHGWNMNRVIRSQLDWQYQRPALENWLLRRHEIGHAEWAYTGVPAKLVLEDLLQPSSNAPVEDYKFYCFGGVPKFFKSTVAAIPKELKGISIYPANGCHSIFAITHRCPTQFACRQRCHIWSKSPPPWRSASRSCAWISTTSTVRYCSVK